MCFGVNNKTCILGILSSQKNEINSFPARFKFCRLLITFANSLDPDQARQNVGPDLDPNCFTPKEFSKKLDFGKNQQTTKKS